MSPVILCFVALFIVDCSQLGSTSSNEIAVESSHSASEQGPGAGEDVACIKRCEGLSTGVEGGITSHPHTRRNPQFSNSGEGNNLKTMFEIYVNMLGEVDRSDCDGGMVRSSDGPIHKTLQLSITKMNTSKQKQTGKERTCLEKLVRTHILTGLASSVDQDT